MTHTNLRTPDGEYSVEITTKPRRIYLASSWKNPFHLEYLTILRLAGHSVYDYRDENNFHWKGILEGKPETWDVPTFLRALKHPETYKAFYQDFDNLVSCEVCVLLMPSGNDTHLELGHAVGAGRFGIVHFPPKQYDFKPGMMIKMAKVITDSVPKLLSAIERAP